MSSVKQDLARSDTASLAIIDLLQNRFREATTAVGPVGNIFTVFFHDFVVHFSGILLHQIARESYPDPVRFPRINKHYALSPYLVDCEGLAPTQRKRTLKSLLRELPLSRAGLGEALPFGYGQDRIMSQAVNLLGSFKPFVRAYLPRQEEQISWLLDTIDEVCRLYKIPNGDVVLDNWRRYAEIHTTESQRSLLERGVIVGTRNNLQNRKLAVNYMQQGKEVVAITHGEIANSVMDEPPFGYSERTLCTTLIDYGDFDEDGIFNKPLIKPERIVYRNALGVAQQYRRDDHIRYPHPLRCRALYIPTTYSGNDLYGPFHIYEDAVYRQWQSALFGAYPGLTMKAHPKSKSQPLPDILVERRQLEDCIGDYDLMIFDYFSTGAVLAIMSARPVIYFDIGLRRLTPKFSADLKNRCEYAKIDISADMFGQVDEAITRFWSLDQEWSNAAMARYSLCAEEDFHWMGLLKSVSSGSTLLGNRY